MGAKSKPVNKKRKIQARPQPHAQPKPHQQHQQHQHQQHRSPTIPFHPHDRILLVGEGDLSFAHALHAHHRCHHILPTTLDGQADVGRKYPHAAGSIAYLEGEGVRVVYGVDATRLGRGGGGGGKEVREGWRVKGMVAGGLERGGGEGEAGESVEEGWVEDEKEVEEQEGDGRLEAERRAGEEEEREMGTGGLKGRRPGWDKIVFNFPHVGGKTKDVNRQVRYNQELLVSFFKAAMPLLAPPSSPPTGTDPSSAIVVTLFESEPYTLWNIRDLARHVGLKVGRSFKFQASAYPGYRHARTLGNVGGVVCGGAWRGEERAARTYVFEVDGRDRASARGRGNGRGMEWGGGRGRGVGVRKMRMIDRVDDL